MRQDLSSGLGIVFFYNHLFLHFEGEETLGRHGHCKDHRSDVNQIIVGVILYNNGNPVCCDMWPENTADVKGLISIFKRTRSRFPNRQILCCFRPGDDPSCNAGLAG
ncbi:hypothetical protein ACJ77P_02815 [Syntrophus buswellii]|uniref:hypothetical protein n=1 Tax=Syntrophus buswellii TaxID=43774 RepID=UPI0009C789DD|nr:MAG: hypothetical protein A4E69_02083 [Syntrophus sp. PtaB.Bin138]